MDELLPIVATGLGSAGAVTGVASFFFKRLVAQVDRIEAKVNKTVSIDKITKIEDDVSQSRSNAFMIFCMFSE